MRERTSRAVRLVFHALAALAMLAAAAFAAAPAQDPGLDVQVDKLFQKWNSLDSPGAAVVVVKDGLVVYRKGFGCAQLEYGIPITPSTVFHVASVSKQFTAMAVTMLEEAGRLSADDDVRKYLPELPDFGKTITLRHLMNHTSGLRDQWELLILSGWRMDDVITQADILDRLRRQRELNFDPGERYLYSNSGFTLLAEVVARVSGRSFADWTRDNIFQPLGMTATHFHVDHEAIVKNRAYSYYGDREKGFKRSVLNYANAGATSLFTTVEDMANWLRNFEDKRVGGAAALARLTAKGVLNSGKEIDYARGLTIRDVGGLKVIGHGGADAGFRSEVDYSPEAKLGVAVFSNLAGFNPGELARQTAAIYLPASRPAAPPAAKPAPKTIVLPAKALESYQGSYWFETTQLLRKVVLEKDKLLYVRSPESRSELVPVSPTEFLMKEAPDARVRFSDMTEGRFETLTVAAGAEPPSAGKRMEPFVPTDEELRTYAGSYRSDELDRRFEIAVKSGALHVLFGKGEDIALEPLKKDYFGGEVGRIVFSRDAAGAVTGFAVSTGRVLNLRFARLAR